MVYYFTFMTSMDPLDPPTDLRLRTYALTNIVANTEMKQLLGQNIPHRHTNRIKFA